MKASKKTAMKVAILVFDGVELLNFAGPGEVFGINKGFEVFTVGLTHEPVLSQGFVHVTPTYSLANCPPIDILVVPGGKLDRVQDNQQLLCWLRASSIRVSHILSVCTGAGLLAKAGLLNEKMATTFHNYKNQLQQLAPSATILNNARLADNGQIITTAGISAGIDGALYLLARLKGEQVARQTAEYMEYKGWQTAAALQTAV